MMLSSSIFPASLKSALRLHAEVRGTGTGTGTGTGRVWGGGRGRDNAQVGTSTERGGPPCPYP
jgi:hypothetical protein